MSTLDDLISFIENNHINDDPKLIENIKKAKKNPFWESRNKALLEAYGNYIQKHGDQLVTDSDEFLKLTDVIQLFKSYGEFEEEDEEEEFNDEIKINLDDSNIDMTNGLNDNYKSLLLNNEEEQDDEKLFPNDPFGQDYNYLDSICLSDYLQGANKYTYARKQPGYIRNQLDNEADKHLDELHNITKKIKAKISNNEPYDEEKDELQNIKSYFNQLVKIRLGKDTNQDTKHKVFPSKKETMSDEEFQASTLFDDGDFSAYGYGQNYEESKLGDFDINKIENKDYKYNPESHIEASDRQKIDFQINDYNKKYKQTRSNRVDRTYNKVSNNIEYFGVDDIRNKIDTSAYRKNFLDMIINGNLRVKFIPNAATRDTAKKYVLTHLDDNGVPLYRLLPTNATDPFLNQITDLNGDQVDDIVLVDKKGIPVIVNGYKLVAASPYKKIWAAHYNTKQARKDNPFNKWLYSMFNKNLNKVNWEEGHWNIEANEQMKEAIKTYKSKGLPTPRISSRLTPNSYWSSIFSNLWKAFWIRFPDLEPLKKLVKYITVSNIVFIKHFDIPTKKFIEENIYNNRQLSYDDWVSFKKVTTIQTKEDTNKTIKVNQYNTIIGQMLSDFVKNDLPTLVKSNGQIIADKSQYSQKVKNTLNFMVDLIFDFMIGYNINTQKEELYKLNDDVVRKKVDIKARQAEINAKIPIIIDILYGKCGYKEYKDNQNKDKDANMFIKLQTFNDKYNLDKNDKLNDLKRMMGYEVQDEE